MRFLTVLVIGVALGVSAGCGARQQSYGSAEEAAEALLAAVKEGRTDALLRVLGPDTQPMLESGDPVQDKNARDAFLSEYEAAHSLTRDEQGRTVLQVGADEWPFPFPIVEDKGKWRFDSTEGVEEIINRRVGANELFTIQACLAYVDARRAAALCAETGELRRQARRAVFRSQR
jgi:hypothetical protein